MAKTGDIVRFLNAVGGGRISRIADSIAYVEDEDGFETPVLLKELVVVAEASSAVAKAADKQTYSQPAIKPAPRIVPVEPDQLPVTETAEGDKLNIVLAFEPVNIKRLSDTTFDTYLVNDSNYYLSFSYLVREDEDKMWKTRYVGVVEPNIQLFIGELTRDLIGETANVALQFIAYKEGKSFELKPSTSVVLKIDTTKFCKLHCFRPNTYFDGEVLAFDIVRNDTPARQMYVDSDDLADAMRRKKAADRRPAKRPVKKRDTRPDIIEVDLHINNLVDNTRGLSNSDMLNLQIDEFRRTMDANLKNHGQKIVFIHGKGEGVLRNALLKELTHRYKGHQVQDASFREYGFGATQVTIR